MFRISLGLTGIALSALFAAHAVGLVGDRRAAVQEGRQALAEVIAVHCARAVQQADTADLAVALTLIRKHNPEIVSASVRTLGGKVVAQAGEFREHAEQEDQAASFASHLQVPMNLGDQPWGKLDLRFRESRATWLLNQVGGPTVA